MSNLHTSHDPVSDFRSLYIMLGIAALGIVCILGFNGVFDYGTSQPEKAFSIDGCDVYRFTEDGETNFFARCDNGKVATTYSGDKHIITEKK